MAAYGDGVQLDFVDLTVCLEFGFEDAVIVMLDGVRRPVGEGEVAVDGCDDVVCCGFYRDWDGHKIEGGHFNRGEKAFGWYVGEVYGKRGHGVVSWGG